MRTDIPRKDLSEFPYNVGTGPSRLLDYMALAIYDYPNFRGGITHRWDGTTVDNETGEILVQPKIIVPNDGIAITSLRIEIKAAATREQPDDNDSETFQRDPSVHNTTHLFVNGPDPVRRQLTVAWDTRWQRWNIPPSFSGIYEELQGSQKQLETRPGLWSVQLLNWMDNETDGDRRQGTEADFDMTAQFLINP